MSGFVSRNSVRGKQALKIGGVVVGVCSATLVAAHFLMPARQEDAIQLTGSNDVFVQRRQPKALPEPQPDPPPASQVSYRQPPPPPREYYQEPPQQQPVANQLTTELSDSFEKPKPPVEATATPLAPSAERGSIGRVSFKPMQMQGLEAGVVEDLSHTIKPGTAAMLVLDQALDSNLHGPLVAHFDTDVRAWDNSWPPLIPKGTPVVGTYASMSTGQKRLGGIAANAYLSDGRIVPLGGAPMTDDLGRTGIPGEVNTRFWERFGNAILVDAAFALIRLPGQALMSQPGTTNLTFSNSEQVIGQVLNSTVNLPPTLTKNQGERIGLVILQPIQIPDVRLEVRR